MMKFEKAGKQLSRKELKEAHPNVCFPRDMVNAEDWLFENGYTIVLPEPKPEGSVELTEEEQEALEKPLVIQKLMEQAAEETYKTLSKQERKDLIS